MSTKRKISIGLLAATIVFVGTALPSIAAPEKIFSLAMPTSLPQTAAMQTGVPVIATIKNETPTGNSSINSLDIVIASGPANFKITGWDPSTISGSGSLSPDGLRLSFSNMSPLKNNHSVGIRLYVTVPAASSCANSNVTWTSNAWTGSSFSGTIFRLLGVPQSQLTTALSSSCQLQFVNGRSPAGGLINEPIKSSAGDDVQVELVQGGGPASWFNGTVTIGATTAPAGASLSNNSLNAISGVATFPAFAGDTFGNYVVAASALGLTSGSASFTLFEQTIACGETRSDSGGGTNVDVTLVDEAGCSPKDVSLLVTSDSIEVLSGGGGGLATFVVYSNAWAPEPAVTPVPATIVSPIGSPPGTAGSEAEVWCDGIYDPAQTPELGGTYGVIMPAGHVWCRILQTTTSAGTGFMQVNEISLLIADASRNR